MFFKSLKELDNTQKQTDPVDVRILAFICKYTLNPKEPRLTLTSQNIKINKVSKSYVQTS